MSKIERQTLTRSRFAANQAAYRERLRNQQQQQRRDNAAADKLISLFYCENIPGVSIDLAELMGTREQSLLYLHEHFSLQLADAKELRVKRKVTRSDVKIKAPAKPRKVREKS